MKSIKIYVCGMIGLLASGSLIVSCTKSFDEKITLQDDFGNSTVAQVFVATVNANRNYVYMDGKPVTGALMVSGSVFPSVGYGFNIPAGLRNFTIRDTLRTSTQVPLVFAQNLDVNKNYTIFTYDTITAPKQKTVLTNIEIPTTENTARVRFANFVYAPFATPPVDVFSYLKGTNIFTDVEVTEVTDFVEFTVGVTDTLYIREAGTMNLVAKHTLGGTEKRSYTVVYRGSTPRGTYLGTRTTTGFANY